MALLLNPKAWFAIVTAIILGLSHYKAYEMGGASETAVFDAYKIAERDQALKLLEEAQAQTFKLQDEHDKLRRAKNAEINHLNLDLADAINQLRNRPERPGEGSVPSNSGAGPAPSCTGTGLYKADAEFLTRESADARRIVADLAECQAAYSAVRDSRK